jgi:hypothetical protein
LQPQRPKVILDDTVRLTAVAVGPTGIVRLNPAIAWRSSDPTIATVDGAGVITGRGIGSASIFAESDVVEVGVPVIVAPWTLVGAGDIADCAWPRDEATAAILDSIPGIVFTAGDNAYPDGSAANYAGCYDPTWGRHKSRTRPTPGNHDYHIPGASAYFEYFGAAAGDPATGYYSFDLGSWHIIAVNSVAPIGPGSAQIAWLADDLAAHRTRCTLAYWHYSLFSSGAYAIPAMRTAWETLYGAGADVVLSGHDHIYERFAPQSPAGQPDPARGIREFVVGTGGGPLQPLLSIAPNSEVRDNHTYGVLKLSLYQDSYHWDFVPAAGGTFSDSGTASCH